MDSNQIVNAEDALDNFPIHDVNGPVVNDPEYSQNNGVVAKPTFKFIQQSQEKEGKKSSVDIPKLDMNQFSRL